MPKIIKNVPRIFCKLNDSRKIKKEKNIEIKMVPPRIIGIAVFAFDAPLGFDSLNI